MRGKQSLVRKEAAHDVLRQVRPVDAEDEVFRAPLLDLLLLRVDRRPFRVLEKRLRVHADRVVAHPHRAAFEEDGALPEIDSEPEVLLARHEEVAHVARRLESDDVGAEQPAHDRIADVLRQHRPVLRRRPRNVHEVLDAHIVAPLADHPRDQVQLVVLDEDEHGFLRALGLSDDAIGDLLVHLHVALGPRGLDVSSTTGSRARSHR